MCFASFTPAYGSTANAHCYQHKRANSLSPIVAILGTIVTKYSHSKFRPTPTTRFGFWTCYPSLSVSTGSDWRVEDDSHAHIASSASIAMSGDQWERSVECDTPNTPPGSEQSTTAPGLDLSSSQRHLEFLSSGNGKRRCSLEPNFASRRNGTINILGTDNVWGSRRSSYSSVASTYRSVQSLGNENGPEFLKNPMIHVTHEITSIACDEATLLGRWQC